MKTEKSIFENIKESDAELFEKPGIHQKLKHKFIELYLDIWAKNVGSNKKKNIPTVDFFDLYAASGWALDEFTEEKWEGSALLAAKAFGEYPRGRHLFLNSYHPNSETCEKQMLFLKKSIKDLKYHPSVFSRTTFFSADIHAATDSALKKLNRNFR